MWCKTFNLNFYFWIYYFGKFCFLSEVEALELFSFSIKFGPFVLCLCPFRFTTMLFPCNLSLPVVHMPLFLVIFFWTCDSICNKMNIRIEQHNSHDRIHVVLLSKGRKCITKNTKIEWVGQGGSGVSVFLTPTKNRASVPSSRSVRRRLQRFNKDLSFHFLQASPSYLLLFLLRLCLRFSSFREWIF